MQPLGEFGAATLVLGLRHRCRPPPATAGHGLMERDTNILNRLQHNFVLPRTLLQSGISISLFVNCKVVLGNRVILLIACLQEMTDLIKSSQEISHSSNLRYQYANYTGD